MGFFSRIFVNDPKNEIPETEVSDIDLTNVQSIDNLYRFYSSSEDPEIIIERQGGRHKLIRLLTDDEICAAIDTRMDACVSTQWQISGGDESVNDFMTETIAPFQRKLARHFWQAVPYGFSVTEVIYNESDDGIQISHVLDKPIEWYKIYHDGTKTFRQGIETETKVMPFKYIFTVRKPTYKQPMGDAILTKLIWPHYFRCNAWNFWFKYIEKFANPFLFGKTNAQGVARTRFLAALDRFRQGASMVGDNESSVEIMNAASKNSDFKQFDDKLVERIQKLILGQTLTSQMGSSGGSFAAANVHNYVREDKKRSDCKMLEDSFNELILNLYTLNGFTGDIPEFKLEDKDQLAMERAQRDAILVNAKVLTLTDQYITDRYDFKDGDFQIGSPDETFTEDDENEFGPQNEFSHHGHLDENEKYNFSDVKFGDDELEGLIKQAMDGTSQPVNVEKIRDVVLDSKNAKDLSKKLASVYQQSDGEFEDQLTAALYAANILGFLGDDAK